MKKITVREITMVGVMAALVFVASRISFPVILPIGETRIHLGNIFCLTAGFVLGDISGGLAAGIGSMFFDLFDPKYFTSAPFTLVFKFIMAFVCAKIAYSGGKKAMNVPLNVLAGVTGSLIYMILHLGKTFIEGVMLGAETGAALMLVIQKMGISSLNAVMAIIIAVPFSMSVNAILRKSNIFQPAK